MTGGFLEPKLIGLFQNTIKPALAVVQNFK